MRNENRDTLYYYKLAVVEALEERGFSPEEIPSLIKDSNFNYMLQVNAELVMHEDPEHWAHQIVETQKELATA